MDILRTDTAEEFARTAADWIICAIAQALSGKPSVTVGLCGGGTPKPVYSLLAAEKSLDWKRVKFFLTDERYVPATHADSNQNMVRTTLLTQEASGALLVAPETELPLSECIADYEAAIRKIGQPDLVLLGMGDDGHITSLFPPVPPEAFGPALVLHAETDRFAVRDRISLTFPPLQSAKKRLFLITGEKKLALLKKMQESNEDVSLYPAQNFFDEKTTWIVGA